MKLYITISIIIGILATLTFPILPEIIFWLVIGNLTLCFGIVFYKIIKK